MQERDFVRRGYINTLHRQVADLKAQLSPFSKHKAYEKLEKYDLCAYNDMRLRLNFLRRKITEFEMADALEVRKNDYKNNYPASHRVEETYFVSKDGKVNRYSSQDCRKRMDVTENVYVFSDANGSTFRFSPFLYWKDDFMRCVRERDFTNLHNKGDYFRVGDNFYDWHDFFLFEDNAYSKDKWALDGGRLVDLSKNIRIDSDMGRMSYYRGDDGFRATTYLEAQEGEEFTTSGSPGKNFIRIRLNTSMMSSLTSNNYLFTMLINDKKRFWSRDNTLDLTKEECIGLELKASEKHIELYNRLKRGYVQYAIAHDQMKAGGPGVKDPFTFVDEKCKMDLKFQVRFFNDEDIKGSGIKAQVLREIFDENIFYPAESFKVRLKMLSEFLKEEKKYAK